MVWFVLWLNNEWRHSGTAQRNCLEFSTVSAWSASLFFPARLAWYRI